MEHGLIGTWRLVSFEVRDATGRITYPFGHDPLGFITYTADGHMAVQFKRADRTRLSDGDWLGAAPLDIAAAARDYFAYCGTYELHDGAVVHRVEQSLIPDWIGGEQLRLLACDGDTTILSTPPLPVSGRQQTATLVWQRGRD